MQRGILRFFSKDIFKRMENFVRSIQEFYRRAINNGVDKMRRKIMKSLSFLATCFG